MTDASRMSFLQQHVCEICGKSYAQKKVLIRHLTLHNNEKLDCSICSKSFGSKFHLQKHDKRHNNRELLFECGQCGKKFLSKSSLTKHTQTKHNNFVFGWKTRNHQQDSSSQTRRRTFTCCDKSNREKPHHDFKHVDPIRDYENKLYNGLK